LIEESFTREIEGLVEEEEADGSLLKFSGERKFFKSEF